MKFVCSHCFVTGAEGGAPLPYPTTLQPGPAPPSDQQPGYPPAGAAAYPPGASAYPPGAYPPDLNAAAASPYPPAPQPSINQLAPGVGPGQHAPPSTPDQGGGYQSGMPGPSSSGEYIMAGILKRLLTLVSD